MDAGSMYTILLGTDPAPTWVFLLYLLIAGSLIGWIVRQFQKN